MCRDLPSLEQPVEGDRVALGKGRSVSVPKFGYDSSNGFLIGFTYFDNTRDWVAMSYEGAYLSRRQGIKLHGEADLALGPGKTGILEGTYSSWEGFSAAARYGMSLSSFVNLEANVRYVPVNSGGNSTGWKGFVPGAIEGKLLAQTGGQGPIKAKAILAKEVRTAGELYRIPRLKYLLNRSLFPEVLGL